MKNYLIYILSFLFFLTACESALEDFEIQKKEPRLNLVLIAEADSTPSIYLGRSMVLDEAIKKYTIKGADVVLSSDNLNQSLKLNSQEFYVNSDIKFESGKSYSVEISADGYNNTSAGFVVPEAPKVLSVSSKKRVDAPECPGCSSNHYVEMKIEFESTGTQIGYYEIEILGEKKEYIYDQQTHEEEIIYRKGFPLYFQSESPVVSVIKEGNNYYYPYETGYMSNGIALYFDDELLDKSTSNTITIILQTNGYDRPIKEEDRVSVWLQFNRIDEHFYKYVTSKSKSDFNEGNPFVEPTTVYSNVNDGLGLAYGRNRSIHEIDITDFIPEEQEVNNY